MAHACNIPIGKYYGGLVHSSFMLTSAAVVVIVALLAFVRRACRCAHRQVLLSATWQGKPTQLCKMKQAVAL